MLSKSGAPRAELKLAQFWALTSICTQLSTRDRSCNKFLLILPWQSWKKNKRGFCYRCSVGKTRYVPSVQGLAQAGQSQWSVLLICSYRRPKDGTWGIALLRMAEGHKESSALCIQRWTGKGQARWWPMNIQTLKTLEYCWTHVVTWARNNPVVKRWDHIRIPESEKANQDCKRKFDFGLFSYLCMFGFATQDRFLRTLQGK